jgi:hypothetical protein
MPRLRQVRRAEVQDEVILAMYQRLFPDRDPVEEPGTSTGTPGDWWTVFALVPDVFRHAVSGFSLYRNPDRKLDPVLRELGQTRAGWLVLGGLYMAVREEVWPRPKPLDVGPFWSFLYGLKVFGIASDIPDWLDIRVQWRQFRDSGFGDLVPFLQVVCDSNLYCFDVEGNIIYWDHEEPDERRIVDEQFSDVLLREIHELDKRKDRKLRGDDKM